MTQKPYKSAVVSVLGVGLVLYAYAAIHFQTRAWIDEIWTVLDPAFRLLNGHPQPGHSFWSTGGWGPPSEDPNDLGIRSWFPPVYVGIILKFFSILSIKRGTLVLPLVRLLVALSNFAAMVTFAFALARKLRLQYPPLLVLLILLFMPDVIHYSGTADLSVIAMPWLLFGLSLGLLGRERAAVVLLSFAALLRFQYGVFAIAWVVCSLLKREWRKAGELAAIGAGALLLDLALNSWANGHVVLPVWNYFFANTLGGMAASYGVTPFYFGIELLWRMATVPIFLLIVVTALPSIRRIPVVAGASWFFFLLHCMIGHKEYRFFFGSVLPLAGGAAAIFQSWLEERPSRHRMSVSLAFVTLFLANDLYRAAYKTGWGEFQTPSRLETLAGIRPDMHGLVVYGWSGIHTGGPYTFHRDLPYVFSPDAGAVRSIAGKLGYSAFDFNYVLARADLPKPCGEAALTEPEAVLYRCTAAEVQRLFDSIQSEQRSSAR